MIIWGGWSGGTSYLNTGARYIPYADTWSPTSTTETPSPRRYHTAVWTNSLMIIWGRDDGTYFNTGGIYNPSSDTWSPTSTTGAPSPRASHTTVWTGTKMFVWGGYNGTALSTGGIYIPDCAPFWPAAVPDGYYEPGIPLLVSKASANTISLSWDVACNATDYAVMEGNISTLHNGYSHNPVLCTTGSLTTITITPSDGMRYFLIVPHDGIQEGSYGKNSSATEIPAATSPCYPQNIGTCPP